MESGEIIRRLEIRTKYVDTYGQSLELQSNPFRIPRNKMSTKEYEYYYNAVAEGPSFITQAELDAIFRIDTTPQEPPAPPPAPSNYSVMYLYQFATSTKYYVRMLNKDTQTWYDPLELDVDSANGWQTGSGSGPNNLFFWLKFYNPDTNQYKYYIFNEDSTIKHTIEYSNADEEDWTSGPDWIYYVLDVEGTATAFLYKFSTGQTVSGILDNFSFVDDTDSAIQTPTLQVRRTDDLFDLYLFSDTELVKVNPVPFFTETSSTRRWSNFFVYLLNTTDNGWSTIAICFGNGTVQLIDISGDGTYTNANLSRFGIENSRLYIELFNDDTGLNDIKIIAVENDTYSIVSRNGLGNSDDQWYYSSSIQSERTAQNNNIAITFPTSAMNNIGDGGGDMFDDGNFIDVVVKDISDNTLVNETDIFYGTVSQDSSRTGYYVGSSGAWPHTSASFIDSLGGSVAIYAHGNEGSDGNATVENYDGSYTTSTSGRLGQYWMNVNYATSDPTIGDLWFTITHPSWSSSITNVEDNRKIADNNNYNSYMTITGSNFILVKVLLSKTSGQNIAQADVETYISAFVENVELFAPGSGPAFADISLEAFQLWTETQANARALYQAMPSAYLYNYDGGGSPPPVTNGQIMILIDGDTQFRDVVYSSTNKFLLNGIGVNQDGITILNVDSTNLKATVFRSGNTSNTIVLGDAITTNDINNSTLERLNNYLYFEYEKTSDNTSKAYLIDTANNQLIGGEINYTTYNFSITRNGNLLVRLDNNTNLSKYFANGLIGDIEDTYSFFTAPYPNGEGAVIFGYNENYLGLITSNGYTKNDIITTGYDSYYQINNALVLLFTNPLKIAAINADGVVTMTEFTTSYQLNTWDYLTTDTLLVLNFVDENRPGAFRTYVTFNGVSMAPSIFEEPNEITNLYDTAQNYRFVLND